MSMPSLYKLCIRELASKYPNIVEKYPKSFQETLTADIAKESLFLSLQDAYEVARYVHSFYTNFTEDISSEKPQANITGHFRTGPNQFYSQLQHGIVLVGDTTGEITAIDTPVGRWHILSPGSRRDSLDYGEEGRITKIFKELEKSLSLVKMPRSEAAKGSHSYFSEDYQFYSVTQWNGKQISPGVYLSSKKDFVSDQDAEKIWKEFASSHKDLASE